MPIFALKLNEMVICFCSNILEGEYHWVVLNKSCIRKIEWDDQKISCVILGVPRYSNALSMQRNFSGTETKKITYFKFWQKFLKHPLCNISDYIRNSCHFVVTLSEKNKTSMLFW